jgi:3-dehydroquinate dehydratase-2
MRIQIINGPNLNRLGKRQPEVYGTTTAEQIMLQLQQQYPDVYFTYFQSNHEGCIIDSLQQLMEEKENIETGDTEAEPVAGVVINPGGLCHTSVSLRDAVEETVQAGIQVAEVHISDISKREPFRQHSLLSEVSTFNIVGHGVKGYTEAVKRIIENTQI